MANTYVETNHAGDIFPGTRQDIKEFLEDRGYNLTETTVIDDFFLHKDFVCLCQRSRT